MARGVSVIAESRAEAEKKLRAEAPHIRILRSREIDLNGLPPLRSGPLPRHWVVVVEDPDQEVEATRPQHDDPENECERQVRQMYLSIATDPELLSTGIREGFTCPVCDEEVWLKFPPRRERPDPGHANCPKCGAHLTRAANGLSWEAGQRQEKPARICIFCGAKADSLEHVIPAWISKRLGIKTIISMEGSIQVKRKPRRQPISFASYRAMIFCKECNAHFKHLEDAVIPLIVPMAKGIAFSLDPHSQRLLALWSVKTAIALISAEPEDRTIVPAEQRHIVRAEGRVPDNTWVGLFQWHGDPVLIAGGRMAFSPQGAGSPRETYSAMLSFEGFGFYVTALKEEHPGVKMAGDRPPMISIWPARTDMVHWPPPMTDNRMLPSLLSWTPFQRGSTEGRMAQ